MIGWITDHEPEEWKEGMFVVIEGWHGKRFINVIGSLTLVTKFDHRAGTSREVPGTECDGEGLGTEAFEWGKEIIAWHPGVQDVLGEVPNINQEATS